MDQKLSYEHLITTRLEALPVPDMSDAIWSRIEQQLDLDMPTGDGGGTTPGNPPGGLVAGGISLLFIIAFVSFLLFNGNKEQTTLPVPEPSIPANTTPPANKPPDRAGAEGRGVVDNTRRTEVNAPASTGDMVQPSAVPMDTTQVVSTQLPPPVTVQPGPVRIDTPALVPRRKGVTGISDSDYRIIPKKDSSR